MNFLKAQRGITFIGFVFVMIVAVFFALMGMRLIPAYIEFYGVSKSMKMVKGEITTSTIPTIDEIRNNLYKKFNTQYVDRETVLPQNIKVTYQNGGAVLQIAYEKRVHFLYNIDFVIKFDDSINLSPGAG